VGVAAQAGYQSIDEVSESLTQRGLFLSSGERQQLRDLYASRYSTEAVRLREHADRVCAHEFDLLGSGVISLGPKVDWHLDFKSGRRWDITPAHRVDYSELGQPSDVKVPWELSRGQYLTDLARAWVIFGDQRYVTEFEALVTSWIHGNPVGMGVNWACTMDVGLRAVSWIWAFKIFGAESLSPDFVRELTLALFQHGWWISQNLEISDINGNHYISDALGLVACGMVFSASPRGHRWLADGTAILENEVRLQVDDDGVDIEASVSYHRLVLEIFLLGKLIAESEGIRMSPEYSRRLEAMFEFVNCYVTPEGLSPVVGDADDGRALILGDTNIRDHRYLLSTGSILFDNPQWKRRAGKFWEDSLWLLGTKAIETFDALPPAEPSNESRTFSTSGFSVLRSDSQYLFADFGPVGFHGRGGHGHNDCLSYEWHGLGRPLLTDSGAYVYTASLEWRNRFRSTSSHNTVRIDGEEINRIPSPIALWSLRNDAIPSPVTLRRDPDVEILAGGHRGYSRLPGHISVRRTIEFDRVKPRLQITDQIDGTGIHKLEFFFHASEGAKAIVSDRNRATLNWAAAVTVSIETNDSAVRWRVEDGWFSPSYGIKVARPVLVALLESELPVKIEWNLMAASQAQTQQELASKITEPN